MSPPLHDSVIKPTQSVPTKNGLLPYINFDNAASTPALKAVHHAIDGFLPWYSSAHRGIGYLSQVSTDAYESARRTVSDFVGAYNDEHVVIFGKNTTEAINKLSYRIGLSRRDVVLISDLEHHSNDLPWRHHATVKRIKITPSGNIDHEDFKRLLHEYKDRVKIVSISGASNVTGIMPDIYWFARKAHELGAFICVDAAQLAAHRPIHMEHLDNPDHIDFIALSGHKMYAPFGTGALIGRKDIFEQGEPEYSGGGTVDIVTKEHVFWTEAPGKDEAGSPNIIGAISMAAAAKELTAIRFDAIANHESRLTSYALTRLKTIPGLMLYGEANVSPSSQRGGVIPFNLRHKPHHLVAAILSYEWGIGVRSGCFCAQPYVSQLLGLEQAVGANARYQAFRQRPDTLPGMVRISFGLYNTTEEIDRLIHALRAIGNGQHDVYQLNTNNGLYAPKKGKHMYVLPFRL